MEKETFLKAKPIWLNSLTNKLNSAALFKVTLNKLTNATLKITASSFYRVFVNNHFIAYGPARAAHNYFRVDYISLPLNLNDNEIVIEVVGYKCNSYYCLKQDPFLIAEIIKNNEVIKATGYDFKAKDYKEKIERVARFSFQRAFLEIYDFTLAKSEYSFNDIITLENRNYISRNVDYPLFEEANCKYIESGSFKINPLSKMERNRTLVATSSLSYNINELDDYSFDLLNDALYTKGNKKEFISENEYETYKCDYSITGFIKIEFEVIENSDVILTYSEINSSNDISKAIDVDYKRNDTINIIRYKANKSNFSYISIEPYTLRYLKVNVIKGKIKVKHIIIIKYENPDTNKLKFKAYDIKLEKIADSTRKNRAKANWIRLAEHNRIPLNCKYYNPRVTFDGLNWWISVGVEFSENTEKPLNDGIGIDIGIKDFAICSDKNTYKNINKTAKVKKLKKKKRLKKAF